MYMFYFLQKILFNSKSSGANKIMYEILTVLGEKTLTLNRIYRELRWAKESIFINVEIFYVNPQTYILY